MKKLTFFTIATAIIFSFFQSIQAEIKLPAILSSNMVLQRNATVVLWGWANPQEKISIKTSWTKQNFKVEADVEGNWRIEVKTTNSKEVQAITLKSNTSSIVLDNVLFGEVWLCSGQSNMQQPVKGFVGQPTFGSTMAIANAENSKLRLFTVERLGSKIPQINIEKFISWQQATPQSISDFSAVAYFFGEQLQKILDCPVGLIHSSWGGSSIQAWMSKEVLNNYQTVNIDNIDITQKTNNVPTALFNSMINPLIPYTIKAVLWYQGETNRTEPKQYQKLFPAMVKDWRNRWGLGDFPFYYVQIAPFSYQNLGAFQKSDNSAFLRESQLLSLDLIPNSGMAVTMDIGEENCIHPPRKKEVADRLLLNALNQTYGFETINYASPSVESFEKKDNGIILKFKNVENGLFTYDTLNGFEIAGDDKVFYSAKAKINGQRNIIIQSDKVPEPVAVRYAWRNWIIGSLFGGNLMPVSSFRTDDWDDATRIEE